MRKVISSIVFIILIIVAFASCNNDERLSPEAKVNAEILMQEIAISEESALFNAKVCDLSGIEEIVNIHVKVGENNSYRIQITDLSGQDYFLLITNGGYISYILKGDENSCDVIWHLRE